MKELIIPNSVKNIGEKAFRYCTSLSHVTIPQNVLNLGDDIFEECQSNLIIYLKKDSYAEKYAKENNIKYKYYCDTNEHVLVTDKAIEPTCESYGLTSGIHCSICGKIFSQQSIIPKLNHSFTNYFSDNNATCTTNCTETAKCDRCNKTNTKEVENTKLGHNYSSEWSVDKEATCIETGLMSKHCIRFNKCKSSIDSITTPAKGHKESDWEIIIKATNDEMGLRRKTCTICGITLKTEYYNNYNSQNQTTINTTTQNNTSNVTYVSVNTPTIKLTSGKKQFKVKYTKVKNAVGFQVRYKIKGKWKYKTYNTKKSTTKVLKGLKKGKYKVQIRSFSKGKKLYSSWTKTKTIKIK